MAEIMLYQAIEQTPGAKRRDLVAAIKDGTLKCSTKDTGPPFMVELEDVQAYVAAHPHA